MQSAIEWRKLTCLLRLRSDKSLALRHCIHLGPRFSPFGGVRLPASRPPPVQGEGQEEGREEGREKEETLAEGGERVGEQQFRVSSQFDEVLQSVLHSFFIVVQGFVQKEWKT